MAAVSTLWPEARARGGMIATPHRLASEAGVAIFERGGNALDAAIAAYLQAIEDGEPPDRAVWLARHPDRTIHPYPRADRHR